jgi:hypothetical protein
MMYAREELMFVLDHYFEIKWFTAVCVVFINVYFKKQVPNDTKIGTPTGNKTSGHGTCLWKVLVEIKVELRSYRVETVNQMQKRNATARIQYFHCFVVCEMGFMCSSWGFYTRQKKTAFQRFIILSTDANKLKRGQ